MDRNELKVQALLEKVSNMTAQYENQLAEYRVDITLLTQEVNELRTNQQEQSDEDAVSEKDLTPAVSSD